MIIPNILFLHEKHLTLFLKRQSQESSIIPTTDALREYTIPEFSLHDNTELSFLFLSIVFCWTPSWIHSREAADLVAPADSAVGLGKIDGDQLLRRGTQRRQQPLLAVPRFR